MKTPLVPLLLLSVAGNGALAFLLLRSPSVSTAVPGAPVATAVAPTAAKTSPAAAAATPEPAPVTPANWQGLKPDQNLHTLVDRLRAAGFPPAVVRVIAAQLIAERFDATAFAGFPFWKQNPNNPEFVAAQQDLANRRRDMLNELLGADARPSLTMDPVTRERRFGALSDDKVDRVEAVLHDYAELRMKLQAERKPNDFSGGMAAQYAVEQDMRKELATILSPTELEQYEMRNSTPAFKLSMALKSVDVTEAEYTALFRAQQAFDQVDPARTGVMSSETMILRNTAQDQLNEQVRAILPDDRFYEYLKGDDPNYARAAQFTANYPTITPAITYDLNRIELEFQATSLSLARNITPGSPLSRELGAQMSAARTDYQNKVKALLGTEIGEAYFKRGRPGVTTRVNALITPGGG